MLLYYASPEPSPIGRGSYLTKAKAQTLSAESLVCLRIAERLSSQVTSRRHDERDKHYRNYCVQYSISE